MSELIAKSGTERNVWDYFGLERRPNGKPIDDQKVICRTCRHRLRAKHGNASNLLAHFMTTHVEFHADVNGAISTKAPALQIVGI